MEAIKKDLHNKTSKLLPSLNFPTFSKIFYSLCKSISNNFSNLKSNMLNQILSISSWLYLFVLIKIIISSIYIQILTISSQNNFRHTHFNLNIHHYLISLCTICNQYLFTFIICINNFKFDFRRFPYSVVFYILEYFSTLVNQFRLNIGIFDLHNCSLKQKDAKKTR